jgi:hypothetical protein
MIELFNKIEPQNTEWDSFTDRPLCQQLLKRVSPPEYSAIYCRAQIFADTFCDWLENDQSRFLSQQYSFMLSALRILEIAYKALKVETQCSLEVPLGIRTICRERILHSMVSVSCMMARARHCELFEALTFGEDVAMRAAIRFIKCGVPTHFASPRVLGEIGGYISDGIETATDVIKYKNCLPEYQDYALVPYEARCQALEYALIFQDDDLASRLVESMDTQKVGAIVSRFSLQQMPMTFQKFASKVFKNVQVLNVLQGKEFVTLSSHPSIPTPQPSYDPQNTAPSSVISNDQMLCHEKVVYSVLDEYALILCDFTKEHGIATLTLKTAEKQYVKFRNIKMYMAEQDACSTREWILLGTSPRFLLDRSDFLRELTSHNNETKFGPFQDIVMAAYNFVLNAENHLQQLAFQDFTNNTKLTTEMDSDGKLRVVERRYIGSGNIKLVYQESVYPDARMIVRAKAKNQSSHTLVREANNSKMLLDHNVPHILQVTLSHGQDIQKPRLYMDFVDGITFEKMAWIYRGYSMQQKQGLLKYMLHIAETLSAMHAIQFVHNDVKPENCILSFSKDEDEGILIDLGSTSQTNDIATSGTYPAPEFAGNVHTSITPPASAQNDIWAFGVTLHRVMYPRQRWHLSWNYGRDAIMYNSQMLVDSIARSDDPVDVLIADLLSLEPERRPTMKDVVNRLKLLVREEEETDTQLQRQ